MQPRLVPRRQVLELGLGAAALTVGGCATAGTEVNTSPTIPAATEKVTLSYWSWHKDLHNDADLYNKVNPDVTI